jgi:hypothetical protein
MTASNDTRSCVILEGPEDNHSLGLSSLNRLTLTRYTARHWREHFLETEENNSDFEAIVCPVLTVTDPVQPHILCDACTRCLEHSQLMMRYNLGGSKRWSPENYSNIALVEDFVFEFDPDRCTPCRFEGEMRH